MINPIFNLRVFFFLFLVAFFSLPVLAQDLIISYGHHERRIRANTFIQIELPPEGPNPCDQCELSKVTGELVAVKKDSLLLRIYSTEINTTEGEKTPVLVNKFYRKGQEPMQSFAKKDILSVMKKGKKNVQEVPGGQILGYVLVFWGSAHVLAGVVVDERDPKVLLISAGLIELATGLSFIDLFKQKYFITSEYCPDKKAGGRIWQLE